MTITKETPDNSTSVTVESLIELSNEDTQRKSRVYSPTKYQHTKFEMNIVPVSSVSTSTTSEYILNERTIWARNNITNWAEILTKIKRFEAKYNMSSEKFMKNYRNSNFNVMSKIDVNDIETWRDLYSLYYL